MNVNQSITWQKTGVVHQKSVIVIFKTQFCHKFNQFWRKYNSTGLNFSHVAKNTTFHALHILVHLLHHVHEALCFGNWCLAFGTIPNFYFSICLSHPLLQPSCFQNMLAIFQVNEPEIKYCDCSYLQWYTIFTHTHTQENKITYVHSHYRYANAYISNLTKVLLYQNLQNSAS